MRITRRLFLSFPALVPLASLRGARFDEHHFSYDHVIGTSLDLIIWTADPTVAQHAEGAVLDEVQRLASILNTRDPHSEISRLSDAHGSAHSRDLTALLGAYADWTARTGGLVSIRPAGAHAPLDVDALGKAYILDRAASAAAVAAPRINGLLLNIGGDIVARGRPCDVAIADPADPHDNAAPLKRIRLHNSAIATSGTYARGAHLLDPRTGRPAALAASATVVAADAVTANALATALCLADAHEGLHLVERTPNAEALRVGHDSVIHRTPGFARLELPQMVRVAVPADWPKGYDLTIGLTLTAGGSSGARGSVGGGFGGRRREAKRPYVAVWIESATGKLIRVLAFWANKERYFSELSSFWNLAGRDQNLLYSTARATREPGKYQLLWDGLDDGRKPVPPGSYRIVVETNQEHGTYAKQAGTIECGTNPTSLTLPGTANFDAVSVQYGPASRPA
jgi:thiamine biosynthesis lipoprotein